MKMLKYFCLFVIVGLLMVNASRDSDVVVCCRFFLDFYFQFILNPQLLFSIPNTPVS